MLKENDEYYLKRVKEIFFDYTRDFCREIDGKTQDEISMREVIDFIGTWVDQHFKDGESRDEKK